MTSYWGDPASSVLAIEKTTSSIALLLKESHFRNDIMLVTFSCDGLASVVCLFCFVT